MDKLKSFMQRCLVECQNVVKTKKFSHESAESTHSLRLPSFLFGLASYLLS